MTNDVKADGETGMNEQEQEAFLITEERKAQLNVDRKRLTLDHSIVLHRDSASAADILEMVERLRRAGMPLEATLRFDGSDNHTRAYARWSEAVD